MELGMQVWTLPSDISNATGRQRGKLSYALTQSTYQIHRQSLLWGANAATENCTSRVMNQPPDISFPPFTEFLGRWVDHLWQCMIMSSET